MPAAAVTSVKWTAEGAARRVTAAAPAAAGRARGAQPGNDMAASSAPEAVRAWLKMLGTARRTSQRAQDPVQPLPLLAGNRIARPQGENDVPLRAGSPCV